MTLLGEQRYDLLMQGREIDIGYRLPGVGRFRVNAFLSQGEVRGRVPPRARAHAELPGAVPAQGARAAVPWSGAG